MMVFTAGLAIKQTSICSRDTTVTAKTEFI